MGRAIIKLNVAGWLVGWLAMHEQTALKKIERYNRTAELQHLGKLLRKIRGKRKKHCSSKTGTETVWG
jgi:hypothetical protein